MGGIVRYARNISRAVASGPAGPVLAGPVFRGVRTKWAQRGIAYVHVCVQCTGGWGTCDHRDAEEVRHDDVIYVYARYGMQ